MPISTQIPESERVKGRKGVARTASATPFEPCKGFHANQAGTVTVKFVDDTSTVDLVVVAGVSYGYEIKEFTVGASITLVTMY